MDVATHRRVVLLAVAAAGLVSAVATLALPWRDEELVLGAAPRIAMALTGVGLVLVAGRRTGATAAGTVVLGLTVLAYPSTLSLSAAGVGGAVVSGAALTGHVIPLTLTQVVPVLATAAATGRSRRGWLAFIVAVAVTGFAATGVAVAGGPAGFAVLSTVLWFGSFLLAPIACWTNVRGTSGERRQRAVVAALASLLPPLIIAWCISLSVIARRLGWIDDFAALIYAFCLATGVCGLLSLAATGRSGSFALRTRTIVVTFDLLFAAMVAIAAAVGLIAVSSRDVATGWAVLGGAAVALVVVLPWLRLRSWTERVVDSATELRHELRPVSGAQRPAVVQAMRRVTGDPGLVLFFRVGADRWVTDDGEVAPAADGVAVALDEGGAPTVLARSDSNRLSALGDCTDLMQPALLEARAADASRRADLAADQERRRLSQNLHDGLQGRLLGLALNLQLSGRDVDDPASRLVLDETVGALRGLVDDVRALGGGRLPEVLVDDGLGSALVALVGPLGSAVRLEVPAGRMPAATEAVAYFVVAEALANALKHANADTIDVRIGQPAGGRVEVSVSDDGVGGADPRTGAGLRGLAERVAGTGGALVVRDGAGGGTVVEAVLPCGS